MNKQRLQELLEYRKFKWLLPPKTQRAVRGEIAGTKHNRGYTQICLDGRNYLAHRLAWLYVHGEHPSMQVDHINGDRYDDRIANLRLVTPAENQQNRHHPHKNNTSGFLGVRYLKHRKLRPWAARIRVNGKEMKLGYFSSPEKASAAYMAAKRESHPVATVALNAVQNPVQDDKDWLADIGVMFSKRDGEWILTEAHGAQRKATKTELVLWKALVNAHEQASRAHPPKCAA